MYLMPSRGPGWELLARHFDGNLRLWFEFAGDSLWTMFNLAVLIRTGTDMFAQCEFLYHWG
jgi:hypothetical protein